MHHRSLLPANKFERIVLGFIVVLYLVNCFTPLRLEYDSVRYFAIKDCLEYGCADNSRAANDFLPHGYPVLLLVLSKLNILHSFSVAFINCMYLFASCWFIYQLFSPRVNQFVFLALTLLSWVFIKLSVYPLSEMQYLFFSSGSLYFFVHYTRRKQLTLILLAFLFATIAFLTRGIGIILFVVLAYGLFMHHRLAITRRIRLSHTTVLLLAGSIAGILTLIYLFWLPPGVEHYMRIATAGKNTDRPIGDIIVLHLRELGQLLLNTPINKTRPYIPVNAGNTVFLLAGIFLLGWLAYACYKIRNVLNPVIFIYMAMYCLIVFRWPFFDPRFWLPVVPFMIAIIIQTPFHQLSIPRPVRISIIALYCLAGVIAMGYSLYTSFNKKLLARTQANGIFRNEYETHFFGKPLSDTAKAINPVILEILEEYD
jgi:hypothetical protein